MPEEERYLVGKRLKSLGASDLYKKGPNWATEYLGHTIRGISFERGKYKRDVLARGALERLAKSLARTAKVEHKEHGNDVNYFRKILRGRLRPEKKKLEKIIEKSAGALIILAIALLGFARNITSFAIYEKEKFNAPIVCLLVSLGILLVLIYYLSRRV